MSEPLKNDQPSPPMGVREIMKTVDSVPVPSDMEKLMATGARLLRSKMDEHLKAVGDYEKKRVELLDGYRIGIEHMRIECEDELRKLEKAHAAHIESVERLITKLKALREA